MRILLATDAWLPQVNGVVRTLQRVRRECEAQGHVIEVVSPDQFRTVPCPTYPEIRLALRPGRGVGGRLAAFRPDCIHIATEGPLGIAARRQCLRRGLSFTTSYHTRFPEYVSTRLPIPLALGYAWMRWFHEPSAGVMVATRTIRRELEARGFTNVTDWSRGVDTELFRPDREPALDLPRPVHLYVGRVAVEKNLEAFLRLPIAQGSKLVVGDGPQLAAFQASYPLVRFVGAKFGVELARHYVCGDVFVFPSRTDTFGLVLLEALASGVPVAAYPVPGPLDVIGDSRCGALTSAKRSRGRSRSRASAAASTRAPSPGDAAPSSSSPTSGRPRRRSPPRRPNSRQSAAWRRRPVPTAGRTAEARVACRRAEDGRQHAAFPPQRTSTSCQNPKRSATRRIAGRGSS